LPLAACAFFGPRGCDFFGPLANASVLNGATIKKLRHIAMALIFLPIFSPSM
jgi:hypothetical protein